jgi:uncharacterized protein
MKINSALTQLSASDLSNFVACRHLIWLELRAAHHLIEVPTHYEPTLVAIQERGLEFEKEYLESLRKEGKTISEPNEDDLETGTKRTIDAMRRGVDIIYQASLRHNEWQGRADFLQKIERSSGLGSWSYEVIDSKLAKETRVGTVLQLCLYSEMISQIQGILPELMFVITPENEFTKHTYRVDDFMAYFRLMKRRLIETIAEGFEIETTYPNPVAHCDICRWWHYCNSRRKADDHLSLVAGLTSGQLSEIKKWNIHTLADLAIVPLPLMHKPSKGAVESYERMVNQARVQLVSRIEQRPIYELLELAEKTGLARLPSQSTGDIYFDFEGDPFVGSSGMQYLFGWVTMGAYKKIWALTPQAEKFAFERFIDDIVEQFEEYPDLHIYHYGTYEPTALKRLMGKYATRENEIDNMLRAGLFVDLHSVTKQALRAGIETYSLKELEAFHEFERIMNLRKASAHLKMLETYLQRKQLDQIPAETIDAVEAYNKEDCTSTQSLHNWLETLRLGKIKDGYAIPRPIPQSDAPSVSITEHQERIKPIYDKLMYGLPVAFENRDTSQQARWLLANMLDWYRREEKSFWWEYFRLRDLSLEEALEEKAYVAALQYTGQRFPVKRSFVDRYTFPEQDCEVKIGDGLTTQDGKSFGEVITIDIVQGFIDIKKGGSIKDIHPAAVFVHDHVPVEVKENAIIRLGTSVAAYGVEGEGPHQPERDLLLRTPPREDEIARVLPIQGPPGAGKSHNAAHRIIELVKEGKKVGIVALSHKVIKNLLNKVATVAEDKGVTVRCIHKVSSSQNDPIPFIIETKKSDEVLVALTSGEVQVAAGTAWLWSREDFVNSVDVLFVDEAGQLSLIDTLAVSQAAKKIVLLGDPQQLKQPQQGSHPDGTEVSALEHILGEHKTIPDDRGIFLGQTWRMHPNICAFISELFYEKRLFARPELAKQRIYGNTDFQGAGLWYEQVKHEGNQSSSAEEVSRIQGIVANMTKGDVFWNNSKNEQRMLTLEDILVIAPYNAQVISLIKALPNGTKVGTVDKFQGQEAPVVIFSLSTSSPEDAPRGMEFLYSPNRLNVAISRARAICILVGSPKLFQPDCKNPNQMRMANAFCRYLEMAKNNSN